MGVKRGNKGRDREATGEGIYQREEGLRRGKMTEDGYRYCYVSQIHAIHKRGEASRRLDIGTTSYKEVVEVVNKGSGHLDWQKGANRFMGR